MRPFVCVRMSRVRMYVWLLACVLAFSVMCVNVCACVCVQILAVGYEIKK
jgi:hypothetical protein